MHTGHWFGAAGVFDANEILQENGVLCVVPVPEYYGKLFVVRVHLFCGM